MQMTPSDWPHTSAAGRISSPSPSPLRFPPRWFPSWSSRAVVHALSSPSLSWCCKSYQTLWVHNTSMRATKKGRMLGKISATGSFTEVRFRAGHFGCGWLTLCIGDWTGLWDSQCSGLILHTHQAQTVSHAAGRRITGETVHATEHSFPYAVWFSDSIYSGQEAPEAASFRAWMTV